MSTNIVNLDALIKREDLASPGEVAEDITGLSITHLAPKGFLYPALRKPDFQRETANWTPEQVADLIGTFARRDLIPAIILWRAGRNVFVIDGAHRLSALVAWVHNDYGDGTVSRKFFQGVVPPHQERAAKKTRELVNEAVGSWDEHELAIQSPDKVRPDVAARASQIAWHNIPIQWIINADHGKAEKSFFRINQGGTKIDAVEQRILNARHSATALAARAILRAGTGHDYWNKFNKDTQERIEALGGEVYSLLFEPELSLPVKTLDVPLAGHGYGPHVLPLVFDLVNVINNVGVPDSSHKRIKKDEAFTEDPDGTETLSYLNKTRSTIQRICSTHPSSLGLHPALYFYSPTGKFQPNALLSFVEFFYSHGTEDFRSFTKVRAKFEEFLMANRSITEAVRQLGSGSRSRPRVITLYKTLVREFEQGRSVSAVHTKLKNNPEFTFLFGDQETKAASAEGKFRRETKNAAYLQDALPTALKCPVCSGLLHRNGMQTGHKKHRREGGSADVSNANMQHPFCNSTVRQ